MTGDSVSDSCIGNDDIMLHQQKVGGGEEVWAVEVLESASAKENMQTLAVAVDDSSGVDKSICFKIVHVTTAVPFGLGKWVLRPVSQVDRRVAKAHELRMFSSVIKPLLDSPTATKVRVRGKCVHIRSDRREDGLIRAMEKTRAARLYMQARKPAMVKKLALLMPGGSTLVGVWEGRKVAQEEVHKVEVYDSSWASHLALPVIDMLDSSFSQYSGTFSERSFQMAPYNYGSSGRMNNLWSEQQGEGGEMPVLLRALTARSSLDMPGWQGGCQAGRKLARAKTVSEEKLNKELKGGAPAAESAEKRAADSGAAKRRERVLKKASTMQEAREHCPEIVEAPQRFLRYVKKPQGRERVLRKASTMQEARESSPESPEFEGSREGGVCGEAWASQESSLSVPVGAMTPSILTGSFTTSPAPASWQGHVSIPLGGTPNRHSAPVHSTRSLGLGQTAPDYPTSLLDAARSSAPCSGGNFLAPVMMSPSADHFPSESVTVPFFESAPKKAQTLMSPSTNRFPSASVTLPFFEPAQKTAATLMSPGANRSPSASVTMPFFPVGLSMASPALNPTALHASMMSPGMSMTSPGSRFASGGMASSVRGGLGMVYAPRPQHLLSPQSFVSSVSAARASPALVSQLSQNLLSALAEDGDVSPMLARPVVKSLIPASAPLLGVSFDRDRSEPDGPKSGYLRSLSDDDGTGSQGDDDTAILNQEETPVDAEGDGGCEGDSVPLQTLQATGRTPDDTTENSGSPSEASAANTGSASKACAERRESTSEAFAANEGSAPSTFDMPGVAPQKFKVQDDEGGQCVRGKRSQAASNAQQLMARAMNTGIASGNAQIRSEEPAGSTPLDSQEASTSTQQQPGLSAGARHQMPRAITVNTDSTLRSVQSPWGLDRSFSPAPAGPPASTPVSLDLQLPSIKSLSQGRNPRQKLTAPKDGSMDQSFVPRRLRTSKEDFKDSSIFKQVASVVKSGLQRLTSNRGTKEITMPRFKSQ